MLPSPMRASGIRCHENSPDELHSAVITGRIKKIKQLVKKGVHIESVNSLGQTPLFCASFGGDYEVVKVLLRLGANPNRRCGSGGAAPIHAASYRGSRRVLRSLVEAGGDLSLPDAELQTPRDYALKQPSPLRRQKIVPFFDLLFDMTLHQMAATTTLSQCGTLPQFIPEGGGSNMGTLKGQKLKKGFFGGSQLSLSSRKAAHQSNMSVWSSCMSEVSSSPLHTSDEANSPSKSEEIVLTPTPNLHKSVSCHLLDQLCVTTSLPLLSPVQLQRPPMVTPAYTCGGPTVYSPYSWIGTPVTVRRPTPALAITKHGILINEGNNDGSPDPDAVQSLLQELSFLRRLRHPVFLEVMAACHVTHPSPDHVTLVYQHVPHGSLYHHLHVQHHDLSVGAAVEILIGLVEALLFMHGHGWFHCGLSSHGVHLVSLGTAKLGGFEYAFESQVKGVGMRAEHLSKASWLCPWQAPETVLEKMVSIKSEVYSVAAIIWEIWSGMPPWAGIEEDEVCKRVGKGERLPALKGASHSLVAYLTEYGLKWNAHERELDLQEVHTMLRSLRIQCNEEERVPAVTSWGPPSIPNTPVIGRDAIRSATKLDSESSASSGDLREGTKLFLDDENLGIKPASHQLTRHSSSCSLASGPPSPAYHVKPSLSVPMSVTLLGSAARNGRLANSNDSLTTSPKHSLASMSKFDTLPPHSRHLSVFTDKGSLLTEATATPNLKHNSRRHSDTTKRCRRPKRRQEMEFEEEFIDDEFDANLFDQPHMQLSVGSAENLLDNRLTYSLANNSASSSSLSMSQHSHQMMTSSEDDDDDSGKRRNVTRRPSMKALLEREAFESGDAAAVERDDSSSVSSGDGLKSPKSRQKSKTLLRKQEFQKSHLLKKEELKESNISKMEDRLCTTSESDEDVFWKGSQPQSGDEPILRDHDLKSVRALRNLEKNLSNYLPTYSIGSDTE